MKSVWGKRVPVLCGQESPLARFRFPYDPVPIRYEIDFTVLKMDEVLEKIANEYDDWGVVFRLKRGLEMS